MTRDHTYRGKSVICYEHCGRWFSSLTIDGRAQNYSGWPMEAPTLEEAVRRANAAIDAMLKAEPA